MKLSYLYISAIVGVAASVTIALAVTGAFRTDTTMHTEMKIIGIDDTYAVNQTVRFQIYAKGYGYSCTGTPDVVIYKTSQPSTVVFHERSMTLMCPVKPLMTSFSVYFPSQNDYYSTEISQEGNYTLAVSYHNADIEKGFMVKTK
ncbi:MAG: hypothetical protein ACREBI_07830 [Nitrosotalea sp.]